MNKVTEVHFVLATNQVVQWWAFFAQAGLAGTIYGLQLALPLARVADAMLLPELPGQAIGRWEKRRSDAVLKRYFGPTRILR